MRSLYYHHNFKFMRQYIRKIQSKSENVRRQILIGSLIVSMSFVFIVWISSLGYKFDKKVDQETEKEISPFSLFKKSMTETYDNLSASVGNVSKKEEIKEEIQVEKQIDLIPVENQSE